MKNIILLFVAIFCLTVNSFATVHLVSVGDYTFSPTSVTAHPGDTIMWTWANGTHTTTSTTIPSGASAWNSGISSSTTSFMYVPTITGTYNYECSIHAGMGMVATFTVVSSTGIDNVNKAPMIKVFPNPASTVLHIQFYSQGLPVSITLTDANGKTVVKKKYRIFKDTDIDMQDIPNGNYILYARQGNDTYTEQLVIAH